MNFRKVHTDFVIEIIGIKDNKVNEEKKMKLKSI